MTLFTDKAPSIMRRLMADFDLDQLSAAAIVGNLGHECGGFKLLQEQKPTVAGSRGGYGWAQWTGPRRREYEAYCARSHLDPAGDAANYAFLWLELRGSEKRAIPAVKAAGTLKEKVIAFEMAFLRAGVKHYDSRLRYAELALATERATQAPAEPVQPPPAPPVPETAPEPETAPVPPDRLDGVVNGRVFLVGAVLFAFALVAVAVIFGR